MDACSRAGWDRDRGLINTANPPRSRDDSSREAWNTETERSQIHLLEAPHSRLASPRSLRPARMHRHETGNRRRAGADRARDLPSNVDGESCRTIAKDLNRRGI